jgi:integrase
VRLFQRENGTWYVSLRHGHKKSLKTKDKTIAERVFRQLKREVLLGKLVALDKTTTVSLGTFVKEYLKHRQPRVRPSTLTGDVQALKYLQQYLGSGVQLRSITPKDLDQFHTWLLGKRKASTVNTHMSRLKAAFSQAVIWGYLESNPYSKMAKLSVEAQLPRFLHPHEVARLFSVIPDPDVVVLFLWYLYLGCRRSELLQLKWEDVLEDAGVVLIRKTKSKEPRVLPIVPVLSGIIAGMSRESPWVFPRWRYPTSLTHLFKKYAKAAELVDVHLHDLRHTTASYLVQAGVPIKTVQEILGHARVTTTEIYAHLVPENLRAALSQLDFAPNTHPGATMSLVSCEDSK